MAGETFKFKKFEVRHSRSSMRVGTDAVLLGAWADVEICHNRHKPRILDVGCGCGLIALMAAQRCPSAQVSGIDIDAPSVEEASENAIASPFADRVEFRVDDIRRFALEQSERFDFVLCNPPYYTEDTLPPDARRSMARNSAHLSFAELVQSVCRVMSDEARFAVVLPMQVRDMFVGEALQGGLHICRECHVKTTSQKTPKRVLLEFINRADSILEKTAIVLQDKTGSRSKEYASLCEDFYL